MFITCPNCSAANLTIAKFCNQCGTALDSTPPPTNVHEAPTSDSTIGDSLCSFHYRALSHAPSWFIAILIAIILFAATLIWWLFKPEITHPYFNEILLSNSAPTNLSTSAPTNPSTPIISTHKTLTKQKITTDTSTHKTHTKIAHPTKQTVEQLCANRSTFISREYCMTRLCHEIEHQHESRCVKMLEREEAQRNSPAGS